MQWSRKQLDLIQTAYHDDTIILAGGATRSGKSAAAVEAFLRFVLQSPPEHHHALVGWSSGIIKRNILPAFIERAGAYGWQVKTHLQDGFAVVNERRVWLLGGTDVRAKKRVQGATLASILIDEATNIEADFFWWLYTRLSFASSKVWMTFNPEGRDHWLKREIIDNDRIPKRQFHFLLEDNPAMANEVSKRLALMPQAYRDRLVAGRWTAQEGLIYPSYRTDLHAFPAPPQYSIGLDFGGNHFAALLFAQHEKQMNVVDELYLEKPELTAGELIDEVQTMHRGAGVKSLFCDPSTPPSFKIHLGLRGYTVVHGQNRVLEGIERTKLMLNKLVRISPNCVSLIEELETYSWSKTLDDKGRPRPVKKSDHLCDALRYRLAHYPVSYSIGEHHAVHESNHRRQRTRTLVAENQ